MTHYVDGFLLPIAPEHLTEYQKIANLAGSVWKEHGALAYWECVGDDLNIADMVSFKQSAGCKENETVVLAWIVYPSRETRDKINAAVMADPRLQTMCGENAPFDYKIPPARIGTIEIRPIRELDPEKDERFQQHLV